MSTPVDEFDFRHSAASAIRALRAERGWTQRELCRRTGLSPAYMSELEAGQKAASIDVLGRIASALGVRFDQFLWAILLAMRTGEVPGVQRRETALGLATDALAASPDERVEIATLLDFIKFRSRSGSRRRTSEFIDDTEPVRPPIIEE